MTRVPRGAQVGDELRGRRVCGSSSVALQGDESVAAHLPAQHLATLCFAATNHAAPRDTNTANQKRESAKFHNPI